MGDVKEAIKKVLSEAHSASDLKKMNMPEGVSIKSFKLNYDAPTSQIEPIYFWLLDFIQEMNIEVEKTTDNFMSSPGSGHFAEIGQRATRMQEEGIKIMGIINQVIKSILNLIYDLKEFELRLEQYTDAKSEDNQKKEAGLLALKQIWLDQVDMKRGRGAIHAMSTELGFTTLREVFMMANSIDDVKKMNKDDTGLINDQVMRILIPRIDEFLKWKNYSEKELLKRYNIEKSYLKSQVETLKLYTKWARPYLKAAEELRQKGFENNPALVSAFNTAMFDLVLFGKQKIKKMPKGMENYKLKRDYFSCIVVSLEFRGIPQKVTQQHYGFGGKVNISFDAYSLNSQEIDLIKKQMEQQDVEDGLKMLEETTQVSLDELKEDLDHFLNDKVHEYEAKEKIKEDNTNPFSALLSVFKSKKPNKDKKDKTSVLEIKNLKKDNYVESEVRKIATESATLTLYKVYDIYKKAHGMASAPDEGFEKS